MRVKGALSAHSNKGVLHIIMSLSMDRLIASIAVIPFMYTAYLRFKEEEFTIPQVSVIIMSLMLIGPMMVRRAPTRLTSNPWFWLLAFLATYGTFLPSMFAQHGVSLVPVIVSNTIGLLGVAIVVYARISLGRNIGFVPAQRTLVTTGAYRVVRHPIYTGLFFAYMSMILHSFSLCNVVMVGIIVLLFSIKSIVEDTFLKSDQQYADYMSRVRYRWLPGVL